MTGIAKAWVQFQGGNGSTAGTINGSFNVSSITVNSTGNYLLTFTTAMANTNYSTVSNANFSSGSFHVTSALCGFYSPTTSSVIVCVGNTANNPTTTFLVNTVINGA
jgi:hypothetical protein